MSEFILKQIRKIRSFIYGFIDFFTPRITFRNYLGFKLFYSRGTGIVDRLRFLAPNPIYEENICKKIVYYLEQKTDPVFLDIGANIGLISMFVLKYLPNTNIFAFEPGLHQRSLLEMTVTENHLTSKVVISSYALSDKAGVEEFNANTNTPDVGGDGFLNTSRTYHPTYKFLVETITLDSYVKKMDIKKVDLIKIDIEGAELWALKGALQTIRNFKPIIFFELQPLNLRVYPHNEEDMFNFFTNEGYLIYDISENLITKENLNEALQFDDMFIAKSVSS